MKTKFSTAILAFLLMAFVSYGQDSVRTRNNKPGTPGSLRTPDNAPKNKVHLIETYKPQEQSIYHGATESNTINNTNKPKEYPGITNTTNLPGTPAITTDNKSTRQNISKDSAINKGTMRNGESNATNPIRKMM